MFLPFSCRTSSHLTFPPVIAENENHLKRMEGFEDVNQNIVSADVIPLECQVAGHTSKKGACSGILSHKDGYVLKPVNSDEKGEREIGFYEEIQNSIDPLVKELKKFVPQYYGTTWMRINKENLRCIVLGNVTKNFLQPCIMDIKIGTQTWDPLATEEKKLAEDKKYRDSKRDVGFCIPGFQVYKLTTGELLKFDREYGKTLNGSTVRSSLKTFLNADCGFSRTLVLQLLTKLWKILRWFRIQKKYNFYSSSLLLVYDAVKLRQNSRDIFSANGLAKSPLARQPSRSSNERCSSPCSSHCSSSPGSPVENWQTLLDNVCRNHSLVNNYEKDLEKKRETYSFLLKDLIGSGGSNQNEVWVNVYMIDFAHVFHSNSDRVDKNYLGGLENLVNIFEEFLTEADLAFAQS